MHRNGGKSRFGFVQIISFAYLALVTTILLGHQGKCLDFFKPFPNMSHNRQARGGSLSEAHLLTDKLRAMKISTFHLPQVAESMNPACNLVSMIDFILKFKSKTFMFSCFSKPKTKA